MKRFLVLITLITAALAEAPQCDPDACKLPDCLCSSTNIPGGLDASEIPQLVFLTFDDAVSALNVDTYYSQAFYNRTNPNGCPVSTTYFASHEYTDYNKVQELYLHHQEIALHSITHSAYTPYWQNMSVDQLVDEFGGERTLVSHFANIPEDDLQGMRLPFLQLSGDNSFLAAKQIGLKYDCSWPTQDFMNPGLWPYTLDYKSIQDCPIGPCPTSSIPGEWVVPMIMWTDQQGIVCSMMDACVYIPDDADDLAQWIIDNFNVHYNGTRAPFGFYVHAAWFLTGPHHFEAYIKFLDHLKTLNDVYIVSISNGLKWIQNPVPLGSDDWLECPDISPPGCMKATCSYTLDTGETVYMTVCTGSCPPAYPWLGNPLGNAEH